VGPSRDDPAQLDDASLDLPHKLVTIILSLRESPDPRPTFAALAAVWTIERNRGFLARLCSTRRSNPEGANWHISRSEEKVVIESATGILRERNARNHSL
jgi:hypothetical protein